MMRVLLCQPIFEELNSFPNSFPMGLLSIAKFVERDIDGVEIRILCGELQPEHVTSYYPDIVGLSLLSAHFTVGCNLAEQLRALNPRLPIIIGGQHITYLPENLPGFVTGGVIGEGEVPFVQICRIVSSGKPLIPDTLKRIPNTIFREGGKLCESDMPQWILPQQEFPLVDNHAICHFTTNRPVQVHTITSRGCPHRCHFCSSSPFWRKVRYQAAETTVSHIEHLVSTYSPTMIGIADDLLTVNRRRLSEIRDLVVRKKLNRRTSFSCWVAGNVFDRELGRILLDMGVRFLLVAVESASPRIYRYLKGNWNNPQKNADAIRLASEMGFNVNISCIVGSPEETVDEMQMTHDYLQELPIYTGSVALLKPYPGSALWNEALSRGIVTNSMSDWSTIERNDLNDHRALFMGMRASREQTLQQYNAIRRLLDEKLQRGRVRRLLNPADFRSNCRAFAKRFLHAGQPLST